MRLLQKKRRFFVDRRPRQGFGYVSTKGDSYLRKVMRRNNMCQVRTKHALRDKGVHSTVMGSGVGHP